MDFWSRLSFKFKTQVSAHVKVTQRIWVQQRVKLTYLKEASLLRIHVVQWNVCYIGLLVYKHGMSLAECATAHILATDSHVESYPI